MLDVRFPLSMGGAERAAAGKVPAMRRTHFGFLVIAALLAAAAACSAGDASPGTAGQTALRTGAPAVAAASRTGAAAVVGATVH